MLFIILCFTASFIFCERVEYFPDKPIYPDTTYVLAHRGGGDFDIGNTLEGCKYGLNYLSGIECDIQRSSNNSLWLNHSPYLPGCGNTSENCFASVSDYSIKLTDSCLGPDLNFTQLDTIFKFMHDYYPEKFISIDVKAWEPCDIQHINLTGEMNEMAQKIIDLTVQYNLHNKVLVESETGDFLYYLAKHTNFIETYLSTNGDFELGISRALHGGFSGISFKYKFRDSLTEEHIELVHRKGLKIQLWTISDTNSLKEAKRLKPDFIQTDLVRYASGM